MKNQNLSDYLIAGSVIACSMLLLAMMTISLSGFEFGGGSGKLIHIDLPSATGLRPNSQVRYAGAPIGKIIKIETLPWENRTDPKYPVRVSARINDDIPTLKKDSMAAVTSDTILAEKFIDILPGSPDAPDLPEGQPLIAKENASFDDLARAGMMALNEINAVISELRAKHMDLPDKLSSLIANAEAFARNADQLVVKLDNVIGKNEESLNQALAELRVIAQNLKVVSTYAKAVTGTLGKKPWRVIWGGKTPDLPSEDEILRSKEPIKIILPER